MPFLFLLQVDGITWPMYEHVMVRGEGPSGEERTPGRSRPFELCSTEDHTHHLQSEAAAKYYHCSLRLSKETDQGEELRTFLNWVDNGCKAR